MTVHDAPASGLVSCTLTLKDGSHQTVGTFKVSDGYGSWTASTTPLASARIW
jgi:hypothetical protein